MTADSEHCNLLITSDLHLGEGVDPATGRFSPREDFFFDQEFHRFLDYLCHKSSGNSRYGGRPWKLILNGDAFCFLQVVAKPRLPINTFEQGEEGWELMRYLLASRRCSAANGYLHLGASFSGSRRQEAGVVYYLPEETDFSGYSWLRARVRVDERAAGVRATFRLKVGSESSATRSQWVRLVPGEWTEVTYDLSKLSKLPLDRLRTLQLRIISNNEQDVSLHIDEIWAELPLSPREERYGLGTTPEQTAWKLHYCGSNHPGFFEALARFLARGHRLAYVKGNHDVDVHWPLVQETFRDLVVEAAQRCADLEGTDHQALRERIEFWPWVYYEPGLLYVEHGNQYEPANFFRDFLNPVLPEDPQRLELPLGSFIVRYAFNSLETVHPWADNVKPATDYVKWLFKEDFFGGMSTLLDNADLLLRAVWQAFRKRAVVPKADRSVLQDLEERQALLSGLPPEAMAQVVELSHERVAEWWQRILRTVALGGLSFVLLLGMAVLLIRPILDLLRGGLTRVPWLLTVGQLGGSLVLFLLRRLVARRLRREVEGDYLERVAQRVAEILNQQGLSVPYMVFGHTHNASVVKLTRQPELPYDQWYVNTGTWSQVWSQEQQLVRDSKQFAFFEIARDDPLGRPVLCQWHDDRSRPMPVLLLGE